MGKALPLAAAGAVLIGLGLYLFPFGNDIFFAFLIELGGGDYWTGILYAYLLTTAMIIIGVCLIRPGIVGALLSNPVVLLMALVMVIVLGVMVATVFGGGA